MPVKKATFEWDEEKDRENQERHHVSFAEAQRAFLDPHRIIAEDVAHNSRKTGSTVSAGLQTTS